MVYIGNTAAPIGQYTLIPDVIRGINIVCPANCEVLKMLIRIGDRPPSKLHAAIYLGGKKIAETVKIDTPYGLTTYELPFPSGVILDANVEYIFAFRADVDTEYDVQYSGTGPGTWASPYYEFPDSITWNTSENTIYFCVYAEVKPFKPLSASLTIAVYPDYSDLTSELMIPFTAFSEIMARLFILAEINFPAELRIKALEEEALTSQLLVRLHSTIPLASELSIPFKKLLKGLLGITGVKSLRGLISVHKMEGPSYIDLSIEKPYFLSWSLFPKIPLITKRPHIQLKRKLERRT